MVDFKKRLKKKKIIKKTDPIEIYKSLDRRSETGPLRPSQKAILSDWYKRKNSSKDYIIKLHTGEGKTLIGLLILQSQINSGHGPCLYVCPNIYLANQVREEAKKFGIPFTEIEKYDLPDAFLSGKNILITHVQKVFHGKTIFGINNKSVEVGSIIIDDSHACIDSIRSSLTIKVKKDHDLHDQIINLFEEDLREQGEGSFLEIESGDYNTMLPVPYWSWFEKKEEVLKAIISSKKDDEVKFTWPLIKDHIENCQAFVSGQYTEITPFLIPIQSFGSFHKANHRILMSATTQDDSFFIKGLGLEKSAVQNPLTNKKLKWSGEKMFLIPSLIDDSLDRDSIIHWLVQPNAKRQFGIVSLIPDFRKKEQYEKIGAKVAASRSIYKTVQSLKSGDFTECIVFANRYDGIDLPDESCRILILDSKPYFDSLLDRYEEDCRTQSKIINVRIAQKVEQGLGRSVRGEKDYSIIVIVGGDLVKFIKSSATNKYFSNQTRKQIDIGMQAASFAQEDLDDDSSPYDVLISLMNQSLQRDEGWKEFYTEEMDEISNKQSPEILYDVIKSEFDAEKYFFLKRYNKACEIMQKLCNIYNDNEIEKGWYLQQLARYKYMTSKVDSNAIQRAAFGCNLQLLKPRDGVNYKKIEFINDNRIKRIKHWVSRYKNYEELIMSVDDILVNFSFGMPAEKFESALKELGDALGFKSQRPDKEIKKGPDNLWCGVDNQYFLFECKSEVESTRTEITKSEAGQMNSHSGWFETEYGDAKCKRFLMIPTKKLSYYANFTHEVKIMRKGKLRSFKKNVKSFFKEFNKFNIHEISDEKIQKFIDAHGLDINSLKQNYSENYYHLKK